MKHIILFTLMVFLASCSNVEDRRLEGNIFDKDYEGSIIEITKVECSPGNEARVFWKILPHARKNLQAIPRQLVTLFMRSIENDGEIQPIYLNDNRIHNRVADFDPGLSEFNSLTINEEYHTRILLSDLTEMKTIEVILLTRDEPQAISSDEDERVYQMFEVTCE